MDATQNINKLALKNLYNLKASPKKIKSGTIYFKKLIIKNIFFFSDNKMSQELVSDLLKLIKIFATQDKRVKISYTNYSNIHDKVSNLEVERLIRNTIILISQKEKVIYT